MALNSLQAIPYLASLLWTEDVQRREVKRNSPVVVLENADGSPSELWNKIMMEQSDSLFAAEAQQIEHDDEHEHDSRIILGEPPPPVQSPSLFPFRERQTVNGER
jgi:hypothetical protein